MRQRSYTARVCVCVVLTVLGGTVSIVGIHTLLLVVYMIPKSVDLYKHLATNTNRYDIARPNQ